ncbi:hypothetical protein [Shinella oryzae]|uniref:Uncharacterized protein n=1 Tax=Shinella oryzae TaxID=2871820 RepID=A0ABY9JZ12_9HYPH|nr:hypothetical protein [Shinella oryzae]WLS01565.1 hypothetical protein Q9315_08875 [Shinella oryzae]
MHLEEQTVASQIILYLLMPLFLLGLMSMVIVIVLFLSRTNSLLIGSKEKNLSWGERNALQFSRFNAFLVESRFKRLRTALFCSIGLQYSAFALIFLLDRFWK